MEVLPQAFVSTDVHSEGDERLLEDMCNMLASH